MSSPLPPNAPPSPKALRVGVIQGGAILEEHHFRRRERVTVGHGARSTIILPPSDAPASLPVFEPVEGGYQLVFTDGMDGRVRVGEQDVGLTTLRDSGLAQRRGPYWTLPLDETSRGRVALGEVTLLFQFVTPPPLGSRAELPPEVRGGLLSGFDRFFLTVLAASVAVHLTCATGIALTEPPPQRELTLDELPDRFARLLLPPRPTVPTPPPAPRSADKPAPGAEPPPAPAPGAPSPPAGPASPGRADEARQRVAHLGLLGALKAGGSAKDVLGAGTALASDFAAALDGVTGVRTPSTPDTPGASEGPRGGGAGKVADIGGLATRPSAPVALAAKQDVPPKGRVTDTAPEVEGTDVDREALARYVKARVRAIQACYERELKRNPSLEGRLLVRFTIGPSGRTTEVDVEEDTLGNPAVAQCIRALMRTWAFPFRPAAEVPVSYPFIFSPAS